MILFKKQYENYKNEIHLKHLSVTTYVRIQAAKKSLGVCPNRNILKLLTELL